MHAREVSVLILMVVYMQATWNIASVRAEDHHTSNEHHEESPDKISHSVETLKASGVLFATAAPAVIKRRVVLYGSISPDGEKLLHVTPRFPGIIKQVLHKVGEHVKAGEMLAVIEANESLQQYQLRSLIDGTIIRRHAVLGEFVDGDDTLFTLADLRTVWAEFAVFPKDYELLKNVRHAQVRVSDFDKSVRGNITYFSPVAQPETQTRLLRVILDNENGRFVPGLFATAEVVVAEENVPVAVQKSALQTIEGQNVVFVEDNDAFRAQTVELGLADETHVEIRSGLKGGTRYAAEQSFILKAELLKGGHDHHH